MLCCICLEKVDITLSPSGMLPLCIHRFCHDCLRETSMNCARCFVCYKGGDAVKRYPDILRAIDFDDFKAVRSFIRCVGVDPTMDCLLEHACKNRNTHIAKYFMSHGGKVTNRACKLVAKNGDMDMMLLLFSRGVFKETIYALVDAIRNRDEIMMRFLIDRCPVTLEAIAVAYDLDMDVSILVANNPCAKKLDTRADKTGLWKDFVQLVDISAA